MMRIARLMTLFVLNVLLIIDSAQLDGQARTKAGLQPLPRDLEIELALSALPSHLRDGATVYVLNVARGFEIVRQGTNGFHAFVGRNDPALLRAPWSYTEYRDDVLMAIAFDDAGAKAQMRVWFDMAEMQARGTAPADLKRLINEHFKAGHYGEPERAGVAYMLSPVLRLYTNPLQNDTVRTLIIPHYMYYAPNVSDDDIGGRPFSQHTWILDPGPHGYMIKLAGQVETAAIRQEHKELIEALCRLRIEYCVPGA